MGLKRCCASEPSSSRTDSPIVTEVSWFEYWRTIILVNSMPRLEWTQLARIVESEGTSRLHPVPGEGEDVPISHQLGQLGMTVASQELYRVHRHAEIRGRALCLGSSRKSWLEKPKKRVKPMRSFQDFSARIGQCRRTGSFQSHTYRYLPHSQRQGIHLQTVTIAIVSSHVLLASGSKA